MAVNGAEIMYMDKEPNAENIKTINISKANVSSSHWNVYLINLLVVTFFLCFFLTIVKITSATIVREDDDPEGNELGFSVHVSLLQPLIIPS